MNINRKMRIIIVGVITIISLVAWAFIGNVTLCLSSQDTIVQKGTNREAKKSKISAVPLAVFVGISLDDHKQDQDGVRFGVYIYDEHGSHDYHEQNIKELKHTSSSHFTRLENNEILNNAIILFLKHYQRQKHYKIVMAGLVKSNSTDIGTLARKLWLELDILPLVLEASGSTLAEKACSAARKTNQWTSLSNIPGLCQISVNSRHEVEVDNKGRMTYCSLEDYQKFFQKETWADIIKTSKKVKESSKTILFFNSTPQGGGVAILRHSTIRFYNLLGINAHWFVMKPNPDVFTITKKKFHNVLQGVAPPDVRLTQEDKHLYEGWCAENMNRYWSDKDSPIYTADVIVFDDPQTAGLIPHIKQINPEATLVYRSHIEIRSDLTAKRGSVYHDVWHYLWSFIRQCDLFVSHPVETFVPKEVKESAITIKYLPATTDPCDGLNKTLDPYSVQYYQHLFNRIAFDQIGRLVDFERPYFVQIARFDPSKGLADLVDAYRLFRTKLAEQMTAGNATVIPLTHIPQLIITGHGSIDDPEGEVIYKHLMKKLHKIRVLNGQDAQWVDDVIVVRLGPSDQMLNAILSGAIVAFVLS